MNKAVIPLGLILSLLAWVVFPLPECYLTEPNCSKRFRGPCPIINQHPPAAAKRGQMHSCCGAALPGGQPRDAAAPLRPGGRDSLKLLAKWSPQLLLQDSPDLTPPSVVFSPRLSAPPAFPAATVSWAPRWGGRPDPIPILQRTQILLI